jgi:Na+(H+)/acetate symporter ActP
MFVFYHFEKPPLNFNRVYEDVLIRNAKGEYTELEREYDAVFQERREAALALTQARASGEERLRKEAETRYRSAHTALERLKAANRALLKRIMGSEPSAEVNYVFPSFLIHYVPAGLVGLMLAVIFAAAMSSFASEINSLASATIVDFYQRYFRPAASDKHYLWMSRAVTLFWGAFATAAASFAGKLGSLIEAVNKVGSYFYGPILGVFLLAFLVRRSHGAGAFWGLIAGEAAVFLVAYNTSISWLYYNVIGAAAVLSMGTLISCLKPPRRAIPGN